MVKHREQQENIRLVRLIKKYPCLYDYSLAEYSKRDIVEHAWKAIAHEMNERTTCLKDKWRNVRTVFLRKIKAQQNGTAPKRKYYLMDDLQFILPFVKMNVPIHNRNLKAETDDNSNDDDDPGTGHHYEEPEAPTCSRRSERKQVSKKESDDDEYIIPAKIRKNTSVSAATLEKETSDKNQKKKILLSLLDDIETKETDISYSSRNKTNLNTSNQAAEFDNPRKMFLLSLLPEVEKMTDKQMSGFRRQILTIVDDILYGELY